MIDNLTQQTSDSPALFPAIAIPVQSKIDFEMPPGVFSYSKAYSDNNRAADYWRAGDRCSFPSTFFGGKGSSRPYGAASWARDDLQHAARMEILVLELEKLSDFVYQLLKLERLSDKVSCTRRLSPAFIERCCPGHDNYRSGRRNRTDTLH